MQEETINNIDGKDDVAEISGEKTVKTRFTKPLPVKYIINWSRPINNNILIANGNKTSNGPATIGGTLCGIDILIFLIIKKWLISITTNPTTIAANIDEEPNPEILI